MSKCTCGLFETCSCKESTNGAIQPRPQVHFRIEKQADGRYIKLDNIHNDWYSGGDINGDINPGANYIPYHETVLIPTPTQVRDDFGISEITDANNLITPAKTALIKVLAIVRPLLNKLLSEEVDVKCDYIHWPNRHARVKDIIDKVEKSLIDIDV